MNYNHWNFDILIREYNEFYSTGGTVVPGNHVENARIIPIIFNTFINSYDSKILEYGCGTGMNLRYLHREGYKYLTGIDRETKYIHEALIKNNPVLLCERTGWNGHSCNIRYKDLDFTLVPNINWNSRPSDLKDFDFIFTRAVFQENTFNWKNVDAEKSIIGSLKIFKDILKDDGKIILVEGSEVSWGNRDWEDIFNKSGFTFKKYCRNPECAHQASPLLIGEKI